jgi:hypothetical protein
MSHQLFSNLTAASIQSDFQDFQPQVEMEHPGVDTPMSTGFSVIYVITAKLEVGSFGYLARLASTHHNNQSTHILQHGRLGPNSVSVG